jgi:hypothetical protein
MKQRKRFTTGKHYKDLGVYLGVRETYSVPDKTSKLEHIFNTGVYGVNGAVELKRIKV